VGRFRMWLLESHNLSESEIAEIDAKVEAEMQEAIEFARQSPVPELSEIMEHIYA
jgi:TPP-dependent pyruvate/acetoin dehydrogenase alpha subunit